MFSFGGNANLGEGIAALAGEVGEERKTEASNYKADFAAVHDYNQLMEQIKNKGKHQ